MMLLNTQVPPRHPSLHPTAVSPSPVSPTEKYPGQIFIWKAPSHHQPCFQTRPQQWESNWGCKKSNPCPQMGLGCRVMCALELSQGQPEVSLLLDHILLSTDYHSLLLSSKPSFWESSWVKSWPYSRILGSPAKTLHVRIICRIL